MYIGPENFGKMQKLDFSTNELFEFLESKKERLDVYHRHVAVVTCFSAEYKEKIMSNVNNQKKFPFFLNFIVTPSNEKLIGVSISNPLSLTPSIYKLNKLNTEEEFKDLFYKISGEQCLVHCGIIKLPFKSKFIALSGPEEFLKKEIYSEKVLGYDSFSFAQKIDEKIYEFLEKYKDGFYKNCKTIINEDGINFFVLDKKLGDEFRPLLSEVISLLRRKHNLFPAKYVQIADKIIGSFVLELQYIFSNDPFSKVDKLIQEYETIRDSLLVHFIGMDKSTNHHL